MVVTGIGLTTGLGLDRESTWAAIRAGRTAACHLAQIPGMDGPPLVGCPAVIRTEDAEPVLGLVAVAADEAWADAGLGPGRFDPQRAATLIGLSKGGVRGLQRVADAVRAAPGRVDSDLGATWLRSWPGAGASLVASRFGLSGPISAPVAACATGLVAALGGAALIRAGAADLAVVGGADASLEPLLLSAFRRMRVLARADDPARAARPWDRSRSGFIVGEGAAVLVLERADHARARGAYVYAELAGGAIGADAHHETDLNPDPTGLAALIRRALQAGEVEPDEVDHVNLHGTATRMNDPLECAAIVRSLGVEAAGRASCSANKAQIGHLLGAAGSAELAIACLAIRDGFAPPTLNLLDLDPACLGLDGTPLVGRSRPIRAALKVSIGFGGHLAAAVLRRAVGDG